MEEERRRGECSVFPEPHRVVLVIFVKLIISSATSPGPSSHAAASSSIFCPCNLADSGTSFRVFLISVISIPAPASSQPQSFAQWPTPEFQLHSTITHTGTPRLILPPIHQLSRCLWRCGNDPSVFLWLRNAHESGK